MFTKSKSVLFEGKNISVSKELKFSRDKLKLIIDGKEVDSVRVIYGNTKLRGEYKKADGSYQQVFVDVYNKGVGIGKCTLNVNGQSFSMK